MRAAAHTGEVREGTGRSCEKPQAGAQCRIVEHRLQPGAKLAEQKLADHFGVSRTLVRQALFQLAQNRLIKLEPARGAFVAAPSVEEAQQVFAVRRMLETEPNPLMYQRCAERDLHIGCSTRCGDRRHEVTIGA